MWRGRAQMVVVFLGLCVWMSFGPGPLACVGPLSPCGRACTEHFQCQWGSASYFCSQGLCIGASCPLSEAQRSDAQEPAPPEGRPEPPQEPDAEPARRERPQEHPDAQEPTTPEPPLEVRPEGVSEPGPEPPQESTPEPTKPCPPNGDFVLSIKAKSTSKWGLHAHLLVHLINDETITTLDPTKTQVQKLDKEVFLDGRLREYIFRVTDLVRPKANGPCAIGAIAIGIYHHPQHVQVEITSIKVGPTEYKAGGNVAFDPGTVGAGGGVRKPWQTSVITQRGHLLLERLQWQPSTPPQPTPAPTSPAQPPAKSTGPAFTVHNGGATDTRTPLMTIDGATYTTWLDEEQRLFVGQFLQGKSTWYQKLPLWTKSQLSSDPLLPNYQRGSSIGVDRDGYIHVAGHMHNSPFDIWRFSATNPVTMNRGKDAWKYWVSDAPGDITKMSFVGHTSRSLPGCGITTPAFHRDRKGHLFASFRHQVGKGDASSPSHYSLGLARYEPDQQRWKMLGGTNYIHGKATGLPCKDAPAKVAARTFFWKCDSAPCQCPAGKPECDSIQQLYKPDIHFDANNRMHIVWMHHDGRLHADNSSQGNLNKERPTHVYYAYSDNLGETFYRADGSKYASLPITPGKADVAHHIDDPKGPRLPLWFRLSVAADRAQRPVIAIPIFAVDSQGTYVKAGDIVKQTFLTSWDPKTNGWRPLQRIKEGANISRNARLHSDRCGILTAFGTRVFRSIDDGATWKSYDLLKNVGGHQYNIDAFALQEQGRYITSAMEWSSTSPIQKSNVEIFTALNQSCIDQKVLLVYP